VSAVLVTGAAGDIGAAVARHLSARAWDVVRADHPSRGDGLELTFDITDAEATADAIGGLPAPAGIVNVAGYQGLFAPVDRYPPDDARRVLEVNVLGPMNVLAAAAREMIAAGAGGAIVNVASMAGVSGAPNMPAYSASKAAVIGLTKAAAKDLAPHGIRVNAVSPGFVGPGRMWETQVAAQAHVPSQYYGDDPEHVAAQMIELVPLRRYGAPDEVASVVEFLLSSASSYLTGVNVEISGGSV
jgi:NAD(P)-dependent dehydrogenase (short-subunit alcohol dehydrogenase family)